MGFSESLKINFLSIFAETQIIEVLLFLIAVAALWLFFKNRIRKMKDEQQSLVKKREELMELLENSEELNKQLMQENIMEKERNDEVVAKISFEIHNCVNGIMGMTTLLKDTSLNEEQIKTTDEIISCSRKLLGNAHVSLKTETPESKINDNDKNGLQMNEEILSEDFSKKYPLKILVAEDDDINQQLTARLLKKLGYTADIVSNGNEALEIVSEKNYDLILMDALMPEMDGYEATRMIRLCLDKQPLIIALTASAMSGDKEKCLQAGMDDYLCKPINLQELALMFTKWFTEKKVTVNYVLPVRKA